jgi:hypothetical protein
MGLTMFTACGTFDYILYDSFQLRFRLQKKARKFFIILAGFFCA